MAQQSELPDTTLAAMGAVDASRDSEWLVTNGLGSYASSTVSGLNTRKYHGLLVAAMSPPAHRMVLLARTEETICADGKQYQLDCNEYPGVVFPDGDAFLKAFSAHRHPRWSYAADGWNLRRELRLVEGNNTVVLTYTNDGTAPIDLAVRPLLGLRSIHTLSYQWNGRLRAEKHGKNQLHIPATSRTPEVFLAHDGTFTAQPLWYLNQIYRREEHRGYAGLEDLWTPGVMEYTLQPGESKRLVCSAEPIDWAAAVTEPSIPESTSDETFELLARAANQFVVRRRSNALVTSLAGYPWLDVNVCAQLQAFAGMFLVTGRLTDARPILFDLANRIDRDLITTGSHVESTEASLLFIHAAWDYQRYAGELDAKVRDVIVKIIDAFRTGRARDVRISDDGLIDCNGCSVGMNAYWYSALQITAALLTSSNPDDSNKIRDLAAKNKIAFNASFWSDPLGCCYESIGPGDADASIRPNQILAMSLPFPVLNIERHASALEVIRRELLTPLGLRTLDAHNPLYVPQCEGNVSHRERAIANGSLHPWLLAHFVRAILRIAGERRGRKAAGRLLEPCLKYMRTHGNGQLPEVFDGDAPYLPGGAPASAVSVCELLRCYVEDVLGRQPRVIQTHLPIKTRRVKTSGSHEQHSSSTSRRSVS